MLWFLLCGTAQVSPDGEVLQVLLDPTGERVATASAATELKGRLFLGSLMGGKPHMLHSLCCTDCWQPGCAQIALSVYCQSTVRARAQKAMPCLTWLYGVFLCMS